jgi:ADP-ribose pyrophosphatase YjhB (NUDIX family)
VSGSKRVEQVGHACAAAGALFFDDFSRLLLVQPSYKPGWEIPGGFLQPGETPTEAAVREVAEELVSRELIA